MSLCALLFFLVLKGMGLCSVLYDFAQQSWVVKAEVQIQCWTKKVNKTQCKETSWPEKQGKYANKKTLAVNSVSDFFCFNHCVEQSHNTAHKLMHFKTKKYDCAQEL